MTSLVSEFLINPVLRTARRFSRSNPATDPDTANPRTPLEGRQDVAVEDIAERFEGLETSGFGDPDVETDIIPDQLLSSSPTESDESLKAELGSHGVGRRPSAPAAIGQRPVIPLRLDSQRSNPEEVDDEVSNNPSFNIVSRFRASSMNTTFGNTNHGMVDASMSPAEGPSRSSTLDLNGSGSHHRNSSLPADDGMGPLRQQIIRIQSMDISAEEKARMMHNLLTRGYSQSQLFHAKHQAPLPTPGDMISQERPTTPNSLTSFIWQMNGVMDGAPQTQQHTFRLSPDDLKRTYAPPPSLEIDDDGDAAVQDATQEVQELGCRHYKRNVKLQCSACEKWYTCRLCHDEAEDHILNRKATKYMLCMLCGYAQGAAEFCVGCGERTAWYYCDVCKLWDNDPNKSIYHCNDCGICRKGRGLGKDFFHCKTCGVCMSMSVEHSHKCIERVSDCDCPICGEYMFTSPQPVVFMLCGHSIHKACYEEHMKSSYKCPICSKSTVNMETQFRNLDRAIDSQPMPPQFQDTKAMVSCNDCYAKSAVTYHWLGLKCAICDSYNTAQLSILSDPAIEVPVMESRETEHLPVADHANGEASSSMHLGTTGIRSRRHSSHAQPPAASSGNSGRFSPYPIPQRIARSVSPVRGLGFYEAENPAVVAETDDSAEEDDLDFWGRDEPRSVTSAENFVDEMDEDEEESSDDSVMDDCDEDDGDEEDDEFALFGHR
ncbi:hypothetical protein BGZ60DRAFT_522468 [Tricladium varicosporioides]|nr:hypothetical protein BGZ60DRAFT_522468 [Hymenoscyphus varicosporioides]